MTHLTITEAAKLIDRSEKTIYRWTKDGTLSFSHNPQGVKVIDTAELQRVCGPLKMPSQNSNGSHEIPEREEMSPTENPMTEQLITSLQQHIEMLTTQLKNANREKADLLTIAKNQVLMLPGNQKRTWRDFFRLT